MHSRLSCPSASDHCAAEKWFKSVPYPIETMWRSLLVGQWYYFRTVGKVVNNKAKAIKRRSERRTLRNTEISSLTGSFILMVRLFRTQKTFFAAWTSRLLQSWKRWENPKMRRNKNINSNKNMINNFLTGVMNINHARCSSLEYGAVKTKTERALASLTFSTSCCAIFCADPQWPYSTMIGEFSCWRRVSRFNMHVQDSWASIKRTEQAASSSLSIPATANP